MSPTRLAEGIERIGPVFSQLYGQTEGYPISVLRRAEHADPTLAGSCGVPVSTSRSPSSTRRATRSTPGSPARSARAARR
jgi:hypothetical protein